MGQGFCSWAGRGVRGWGAHRRCGGKWTRVAKVAGRGSGERDESSTDGWARRFTGTGTEGFQTGKFSASQAGAKKAFKLENLGTARRACRVFWAGCGQGGGQARRGWGKPRWGWGALPRICVGFHVWEEGHAGGGQRPAGRHSRPDILPGLHAAVACVRGGCCARCVAGEMLMTSSSGPRCCAMLAAWQGCLDSLLGACKHCCNKLHKTKCNDQSGVFAALKSRIGTNSVVGTLGCPAMHGKTGLGWGGR